MNAPPDKGQNEKYYAGRSVLVTGASGFIGTPLIDALARLGACVHGVSRNKVGNQRDNLRWWKGELEDLEVTRKILRKVKPSLVIHLAGHAWVKNDLSSVPATFYGCLVTTVNVLTSAVESGCRKIVLPGSMEEAGGSDAIPNSPYSAAKWGCGVYGRMFREIFGTAVVRTRIFMAYGPGQNDGKVIPYIILSLLRGQRPILRSHDRIVDWIYIDDVVEGLLAASRWDRPDDDPVDIGSGKGMSVKSLTKKLCRIIDPGWSQPFDVKPNIRPEVVRVANVERTFEKIGWRPKVSLDTGLVETVDWYKAKSDIYRKGDIQTRGNAAITKHKDEKKGAGL